jgi:hypothetical protein
VGVNTGIYSGGEWTAVAGGGCGQQQMAKVGGEGGWVAATGSSEGGRVVAAKNAVGV